MSTELGATSWTLLAAGALALTLCACRSSPSPEPRDLPFDGGEATAPTRPRTADDVELARRDGEPLPLGRPLALESLRLSCVAGPEPGLDNEDPAAQAAERLLVELEVAGWASVTVGVHVVLWDGQPDPPGAPHPVAYRALRPMMQDPAGSSSAPFEHDRFTLPIPVLPIETAGPAFGTTLPCTPGDPSGLALHDLMVCATDARDLVTARCWFCGPHLGADSAVPGDTVGRVTVSGIPGHGGGLSVTDEVVCAYGRPSP